MYGKDRYLGKWRAILDMAESLRHDLRPNTYGYSDAELEKKNQEVGRYKICVEKGEG